MNTLRIAQIGSTEPIDFSKTPLPAPFADREICVDHFIESLADVDNDTGIFHGAELEKRHLQAPYDLLLLTLPECSDPSEKIPSALQSLFQNASAFAASYTLPIFYSTDLGLKGENELRGELKNLRDRLYEAHEEIERLREFNQMLLEESEHLRAMQTSMEYSYEVISNSFFWKLTKPFRLLADVTKKGIKKIPPLHAVFKGLRYWQRNGTRAFFRKITERGGARHAGAYSVSKKELRAQEEATFERDVKFSILVPLYNTPTVFLKEMIASVQAQTYSNWELCLADGSDAGSFNPLDFR